MRQHHLARLQAAFDAEGQRRKLGQLRSNMRLPDPAPPAPWYDRLLIGITFLLGTLLLVRAVLG